MSDHWPFRLREVWSLEAGGANTKVFEFSYRTDTYFVQEGASLSFWIADGMSSEDLRLHTIGERWVTAHHAVGLDTSIAGDVTVPSAADRRQAIEILALKRLSKVKRFQVLEGLFFPLHRCYLALVEDLDTGCAFLVGSSVAPRKVRRSEAAPWRRLAVAIGEMVSCGELNLQATTTLKEVC